ncbi:MAG: VCBS repeat-containing protein [Flavobacteriales bacterium]|nr:VCBS repeat-containing protein [Flavobacteriales bacterium]
MPPIPTCVGNPASNGLWYRYTATEDQALQISTSLPVNVGLDTRFHVYSGSCAALSCIGGDDDSGSGYLSIATVSLTAGNSYYIAFDNFWSSTGFTVELSLGTPPPPPPDNYPTFTSQTLTSGSVWAIVDMNGDHRDDAVRVSASSVFIHEQQANGTFSVVTVPTPPALHQPSWSLAAGDIDGNGWNDLMYGGGQGVSFMLRSNDGNSFTHIPFTQYIFSQRTNMVDINNDGLLDAFVCHDVDANVHFLNMGNGQLQFIQGGLGETCGNYGSLWTDVNNDGLVDLFVAKCGCDPVDIMMENHGYQNFISTAVANQMADSHQSWSAAWGDFDNDGDMDVLIGSSSSSYHKLMRNDGNGNFTNVTAGSGFEGFNGTSIEWTTHDFDNDGNLDIMGGGRIMMGYGDMTFGARPGSVSNGPVGDLNNDGFLDYMNSGTAYMNNGNDNHWVKVHTVGTISNTNGIGARVVVTTASGTRIREVRSGDGFRFMSSLTTHFGLGQDTQIEEITVYWPSGIVQTISNPAIDQTLVVVESTSTSIAETVNVDALTIHPNPVRDQLNLTATQDITGAPFRVIDAAGKLVLGGRIAGNTIDVSMLQAGAYTIQVLDQQEPMLQRFVKQ